MGRSFAPLLIFLELFGHEAGAFTGDSAPDWPTELDDGGTIFLDEVGELPPDTQVSLLRVLQERQFERVGERSLSTSSVIVSSGDIFSVDESWLSKKSPQPASQVERCRLSKGRRWKKDEECRTLGR